MMLASELFSALVGINVKVVRDQNLCNINLCANLQLGYTPSLE